MFVNLVTKRVLTKGLVFVSGHKINLVNLSNHVSLFLFIYLFFYVTECHYVFQDEGWVSKVN